MWYFFFASSETWILIGLALIIYLVAVGIKSATSSLSDSTPKLDNISVVNQKSKSGKCYVKNYGFYKPLKKYVAEVVCPELKCERMVVADSQERLEQLICKEFDSLEEACR